jgi:hypothetical protein
MHGADLDAHLCRIDLLEDCLDDLEEDPGPPLDIAAILIRTRLVERFRNCARR